MKLKEHLVEIQAKYMKEKTQRKTAQKQLKD
jgi:hypothetical protein